MMRLQEIERAGTSSLYNVTLHHVPSVSAIRRLKPLEYTRVSLVVNPLTPHPSSLMRYECFNFFLLSPLPCNLENRARAVLTNLSRDSSEGDRYGIMALKLDTDELVPEVLRRYHPSSCRWVFAQRFLDARGSDYARVMMVDVGDTLFQANPYDIVGAPGGH